MSGDIRKENYIITYFHLLGAVLVFVGHWFILCGYNVPLFFNQGIQGWGVHLLFFISGYLAWNSISRRENVDWKFFIRKMKRILPPLWVCLGITVGGLFLVSENRKDYFFSAVKYLLSNAILIPRHDLAGVFERNPYPSAVNGSLWTMPVEMACMFSVPFIYLVIVFFRKRCADVKKSKVVSVVFILLICFLIQVMLHTHIVDIFPSVTFIVTNALQVSLWFMLGILVKMLNSPLTVGIIGGMWLISHLILMDKGINCLLYVVWVIIAELILFGECRKTAKLPKIKNICYGMYLYGFPIQQTVIYLTRVKNNIQVGDVVLFIIALFIDILLAYGSYVFVEQRHNVKIQNIKGDNETNQQKEHY